MAALWDFSDVSNKYTIISPLTMRTFVILLLSLFLCITDASFAQHNEVILFISDTQQPMLIETIRLKTQENERMTQRLFSMMAKETTAAALFHLGDITSMGMMNSYWKSFDTLRTMLPFPVHAAFGNHEYFFVPAWGKEQMLKRFPSLEPSWYLKRFGAAAVIVLNSNFDRLSEEEKEQQERWYKQTLASLEKDSTVTSVIVACHHSPLTNSSIVSPNEDVQRSFVRPFVQSKKGSAFISGHAHTREHFRMEGKDLFVIGGGGGLQQPLKDTSDAEWIGEKIVQRQFFHYVRCEMRNDALLFQIVMLKEDGTDADRGR
jgi:hypothetical protein